MKNTSNRINKPKYDPIKSRTFQNVVGKKETGGKKFAVYLDSGCNC